MRVVPDTNVLIRAHGSSPAFARKLLRALLEQGHHLILSNEILVEVVKVLRYPHFQQLYRMTEADLLEYVQFLQSISNLVMLDPHYRAPFLRDAKDTHVLQTAEQGQADIICTHDRDFYDQAVRLFCLSRGIEICNEASLWNRLKTH